ncbi:carboxypeptidase-like regulatory domain-containing protein [Hymenobacter sp. BT186]|uniref:Carboxypeptidase-like regulatory domain-containing protein n=1 Tax=Hymenobacter telluris TaxID=2816474 RepID=A0A939EX38_9BACT|nr:carboxypeptidase-like regulatory domain-containing protein [Hymenobacter telluris]MBO0358787.1 carboxypeptidase-like regulatory domain-containing protein [Hymenobacter telluris]MBW3374813.1 carboxypeptidase-like regulatory domain-containing protein [Hymenobacter norwichensis]
MRYAAILLLFLLVNTTGGWAQSTLNGTIRDSLTQKPLELASVFLANTTYGASTNASGQFTIKNVPAGPYDLIVSYVGYQLFKRRITVGNGAQPLELLLTPSAQQLKGVTVRPNPNRESDYQKFAETFLGRTSFSRQCRIRNPDAVLVAFDAEQNQLTASSPTFVQVDNDALGYRVKYYGLEFTLNFKQQYVSFYGWPVFEEMTPRRNKQRQRWLTNREKAYRGSLTHFLKSVRDNDLAQQGFLVRKLRIVPNPRFARTDSLRKALLRARRNQALTAAEMDSIDRWVKMPPNFSMLYMAERPIDSLRRAEFTPKRVYLRFSDYLQVSYLREAPDPLYQPARPFGAPPGPVARPIRQISLLTLTQPEVEILPNGQLVEPLAVLTDEYWAFEKMGELLPLDYQPPPSTTPR